MRICDMKVGARLAVGFGTVLSLVGVFVMVALFLLTSVEKNAQRINDRALPFAILSDQLAFDTVQVQQFLTDVSATHDPGGYKEAEEAARDFHATLAKLEAAFRAEKNEKAVQDVQTMKGEFNDYYALGKKMAQAYVAQGIAPGNVIMEEFDKTSERITKKVQEFREEQIKDSSVLTGAMTKKVRTARLTVIILGLLALMVGVVISLAITRSIAKPVQEAVHVIERMAQGDLTMYMVCDSRDEIGQLASSVNHLVKDMNQVFTTVVSASGTLASASSELLCTSEQVAESICQVASQSTIMSAAGEEMAVTSEEIARNCTVAAESSLRVDDSTHKSSGIIQETARGMQRISEKVTVSAARVTSLGTRSEQIGEIVGTIEDIADQTNLLALNAAIEAARAGEQGRGFAVVADEVRALANRTQKATQDISVMIAAIQKEIKNAVDGMKEGVDEATKGTAEAARSGRALEEVLEQVETITHQINEISAAANAQTEITREVSCNLQEITQVVDGTAQGMRNSSAAAAQLAHLAEELQAEVRRFKLS